MASIGDTSKRKIYSSWNGHTSHFDVHLDSSNNSPQPVNVNTEFEKQMLGKEKFFCLRRVGDNNELSSVAGYPAGFNRASIGNPLMFHLYGGAEVMLKDLNTSGERNYYLFNIVIQKYLNPVSSVFECETTDDVRTKCQLQWGHDGLKRGAIGISGQIGDENPTGIYIHPQGGGYLLFMYSDSANPTNPWATHSFRYTMRWLHHAADIHFSVYAPIDDRPGGHYTYYNKSMTEMVSTVIPPYVGSLYLRADESGWPPIPWMLYGQSTLAYFVNLRTLIVGQGISFWTGFQLQMPSPVIDVDFSANTEGQFFYDKALSPTLTLAKYRFKKTNLLHAPTEIVNITRVPWNLVHSNKSSAHVYDNDESSTTTTLGYTLLFNRSFFKGADTTLGAYDMLDTQMRAKLSNVDDSTATAGILAFDAQASYPHTHSGRTITEEFGDIQRVQLQKPRPVIVLDHALPENTTNTHYTQNGSVVYHRISRPYDDHAGVNVTEDVLNHTNKTERTVDGGTAVSVYAGNTQPGSTDGWNNENARSVTTVTYGCLCDIDVVAAVTKTRMVKIVPHLTMSAIHDGGVSYAIVDLIDFEDASTTLSHDLVTAVQTELDTLNSDAEKIHRMRWITSMLWARNNGDSPTTNAEFQLPNLTLDSHTHHSVNQISIEYTAQGANRFIFSNSKSVHPPFTLLVIPREIQGLQASADVSDVDQIIICDLENPDDADANVYFSYIPRDYFAHGSTLTDQSERTPVSHPAPLSIPPGVKHIVSNAFKNLAISSVDFSKATDLTTIGDGAFDQPFGMEHTYLYHGLILDVILPGSLNKVEKRSLRIQSAIGSVHVKHDARPVSSRNDAYLSLHTSCLEFAHLDNLKISRPIVPSPISKIDNFKGSIETSTVHCTDHDLAVARHIFPNAAHVTHTNQSDQSTQPSTVHKARMDYEAGTGPELQFTTGGAHESIVAIDAYGNLQKSATENVPKLGVLRFMQQNGGAVLHSLAIDLTGAAPLVTPIVGKYVHHDGQVTLRHEPNVNEAVPFNWSFEEENGASLYVTHFKIKVRTSLNRLEGVVLAGQVSNVYAKANTQYPYTADSEYFDIYAKTEMNAFCVDEIDPAYRWFFGRSYGFYNQFFKRFHLRYPTNVASSEVEQIVFIDYLDSANVVLNHSQMQDDDGIRTTLFDRFIVDHESNPTTQKRVIRFNEYGQCSHFSFAYPETEYKHFKLDFWKHRVAIDEAQSFKDWVESKVSLGTHVVLVGYENALYRAEYKIDASLSVDDVQSQIVIGGIEPAISSRDDDENVVLDALGETSMIESQLLNLKKGLSASSSASSTVEVHPQAAAAMRTIINETKSRAFITKEEKRKIKKAIIKTVMKQDTTKKRVRIPAIDLGETESQFENRLVVESGETVDATASTEELGNDDGFMLILGSNNDWVELKLDSVSNPGTTVIVRFTRQDEGDEERYFVTTTTEPEGQPVVRKHAQKTYFVVDELEVIEGRLLYFASVNDGGTDTTPPVITPSPPTNLPSNASYNANSFTTSYIVDENATAYIDPGATALDEVDGAVSVTTTGEALVDLTTEGTYSVHYDAQDSAGNQAVQVTRTIVVAAATHTSSGDPYIIGTDGTVTKVPTNFRFVRLVQSDSFVINGEVNSLDDNEQKRIREHHPHAETTGSFWYMFYIHDIVHDKWITISRYLDIEGHTDHFGSKLQISTKKQRYYDTHQGNSLITKTVTLTLDDNSKINFEKHVHPQIIVGFRTEITNVKKYHQINNKNESIKAFKIKKLRYTKPVKFHLSSSKPRKYTQIEKWAFLSHPELVLTQSTH